MTAEAVKRIEGLYAKPTNKSRIEAHWYRLFHRLWGLVPTGSDGVLMEKLRSEILRLRLENAHLRNEIKRCYMRIGNLNSQIEYLLFENRLKGE